MRQILLLALCVALAAARAPTTTEGIHAYTFQQYTADYRKQYSAAEYEIRQGHFERAKAEILAHNAKSTKNYYMGISHLTDASPQEYKRMLGGRPRMAKAAAKLIEERRAAAPADAPSSSVNTPYNNSGISPPMSVDWRMHAPAVLTGVKNQGFCGSCWAHASTENIESHWAIKTGELFTLSQQEVTACAPNPNQCGGNGGCGGSVPELAFDYIATNGIAEEWSYPYTAFYGDTGVCNNSFVRTPVAVTGSVKLATNSQADVMDALARVGPLAVNVAAAAWQHYKGGIYDGCAYNITVDHVVQLVGYGHDYSVNQDYWIIRNSWSADWGENGFIRLVRHATPTCGWDVNPMDGTGCEDGPKQLWSCGQCGVLMDVSYPSVEA